MIRKWGGEDLAKVLIYFGLINEPQLSEFNIVCPFHVDINPSMKITLHNGKFFCFGCGVSGDAYDFIRLVKPDLSDLQACITLERILHSNEVEALKIKYTKRKKQSGKQALIEAIDYYYGLKACDWHECDTPEAKSVIEYMQKRGIDKRTLNLCGCRMNYSIAYPFIFPIMDNGTFKGWVGRTMNKYVEKKRKYFYNDGFVKSDTLCGTYSEKSVVYICEGYFDYLKLRYVGGIKNVCAILGWHISEQQLKKLKDKHITTVVCALDNPVIDKSGKKGLELLKQHFDVIPFPYPKGRKDAGDMTKEQILKAKKTINRKLRQMK